MTAALSMAIDQFNKVQLAERKLEKERANLETDVARLGKEDFAEYARITEGSNATS